MSILEHKHLIVRAELNAPPYDTVGVKHWMEQLVESIGMNILMGPFVVYHDMEGNRGLTAMTIIMTSHISLHVWDEDFPALMQLDVYTCSNLDIAKVFSAIKCWDPIKIEYKYIDRENSLILL